MTQRDQGQLKRFEVQGDGRAQGLQAPDSKPADCRASYSSSASMSNASESAADLAALPHAIIQVQLAQPRPVPGCGIAVVAPCNIRALSVLRSQLLSVHNRQAGRGGAPQLRCTRAKQGRPSAGSGCKTSSTLVCKQPHSNCGDAATATVGMPQAGRQAHHLPVNSPTASVGKANDLAPSGLNRRLQGNCQ